MPQPQPPRSLLDALLAYEAHVQSTMPPKQATAAWAQVRTALWRYTLPGWGLPSPQGQRLSPAEYEQGLQLLQQLPFERLQEAPLVQEQLFEQLAVAGNSRRTYRWALQRFMAWCQQSWLETVLVGKYRLPTARARQHQRSANDVRLTTRRARQPYRLVEAERSEALRQELALFAQFLTGAGAGEQDSMSVSAATAKQYLHQVERFLGWLHRERGVPLQELSLQQLVVSAGSMGRDQPVLPPQEETERVVALVQAYLEWLRTPKEEHLDGRSEAVQSPYTALKVINAWLAVVRFVYRQDSVVGGEEAEQAQVTIASLQKLRKVVNAQLKNHQAVSDESRKRLEWHEFLDLVEMLRGECVSRLHQSTQSKQSGSTLAPPRSLTAIAQSYQRFLLAAFLAYIPPQRSRVLRQLVFSPLPLPEPVLEAQALDSEASVLYPNQEGWWLKLVDQKFRRQQSPYLVFVPNLSYSDGRCFYQYLEEWLLHYVYQDVRGKTVAVPGLRSCFNPHHQRLFTLKKGEPYPDAVSFSKLLRQPAYRFTGKAIDFHTLRGVYAKHLKSKEYAGLAAENLIHHSKDKVLSSVFAALDREEKEQDDPAAWSKAAAIAQAFLNQLV